MDIYFWEELERIVLLTTVVSTLVLLILALLKMRPNFCIAIRDIYDSAVVKDKNPPNQYIMRFLRISIFNPFYRPSFSIYKVECIVKDLKNGRILQKISYSYLYERQLTDKEEDNQKIQTIKSGTDSIYTIPDFLTGVDKDGEYEVRVKVRCLPTKGGEIRKSASTKFIIKQGRGEFIVPISILKRIIFQIKKYWRKINEPLNIKL